MNQPDFGGMVREHRKRLGLTHARVAELVGCSPGDVRAWEAGRKLPNDTGLLSTISAVLAVNEASLFRAAGVELQARNQNPTIEQSLASIAPSEAEEISPVEPPAPMGWPTRNAGDTASISLQSTPTPAGATSVLSYIEDTDQRMTYRLRGVFTALGLAVALVVFVWAASNFLDALGDAWDSLFGNL